MAQLVVNPVTITSTGVHSPARTLPGKVTDVVVTMTSPVVDSTTGALDWDVQAGTGAFAWGLEYSSNSGATWRWLVHQPGDGAPVDQYVIGTRNHSGGMPTLSPSAQQIKGVVGDRVRLAATTVPFSSAPASTPVVQCGAVVDLST